MAKLVPNLQMIKAFPTILTRGEETLMNALLAALDDSWTIYVQPYLNGLKPDIIIFSETRGFVIFEVKDWNLNNYKIDENENWSVYNSHQQDWIRLSESKTPFYEVDKHKNSLFDYQLPELGGQKILNTSYYAIVTNFVYFHFHKQIELEKHLRNIKDRYKHFFGKDRLEKNTIINLLKKYRSPLPKEILAWMRDNQISTRVQSVFHYPEHGKFKHELTRKLSKEQSSVLNIDSGIGIHVLGSAGSGKTYLLARKAVEAALVGKHVLVVCFNITMSHYLLDVIKFFARDKSLYAIENIQVLHYHLIFPLHNSPRSVKLITPIDVILVDEGQDFEKVWIENLLKLEECKPQVSFTFFEDDRQNIYKRILNNEDIPNIKQRIILKKSYRLSNETAKFANLFINWTQAKSRTEDIETTKQPLLMFQNTWFGGETKDEVLTAIEMDISSIANGNGSANAKHISDNAILVCRAEDGWAVCDLLKKHKIAYQTNFESREENNKLIERFEDGAMAKEEIEKLRRYYKAGFWMQSGKLKVCTIHSFKGWELSNIMVFFNPDEKQQQVQDFLLYTAITRSIDNLIVYTHLPRYVDFGNMAIAQKAVAKW